MPMRDRVTAKLPGEFVVFLVGMRINHPLLVHRWLPVAAAMPRTIKEGCLASLSLVCCTRRAGFRARCCRCVSAAGDLIAKTGSRLDLKSHFSAMKMLLFL